MWPLFAGFSSLLCLCAFHFFKVPWDSDLHSPQWLLCTVKDALCEVWNSWLICVKSENEKLLYILNVGLIFKWWNTGSVYKWYVFLYISHLLPLCYSKMSRTCISFSNERKKWISAIVSPKPVWFLGLWQSLQVVLGFLILSALQHHIFIWQLMRICVSGDLL